VQKFTQDSLENLLLDRVIMIQVRKVEINNRKVMKEKTQKFLNIGHQNRNKKFQLQ
jgi:hypothetical protein